MTQLEKHERAIKLLNAIQECERRIDNHDTFIYEPDADYYWNMERIDINRAIKTRLEAYYNKSFKI